MFTPASKMSPKLKTHLRYPEDIFTVQASMYGKYHITTASSFYSAADAWALSPSPGSGSPSQALQTTLTTNAQGQEVSTGQLVRMAPIYQVLKVPGQNQQSFNLLDAFVPISGQSQIQTLSGFMIAGSDPGDYGKLQMFVTPRNNPVNGPAIVAAKIDATAAVSQQDHAVEQNGSSVLLGNVLMIPVADSLLYIQPLYVESSRNAIPELQQVIAVYGKPTAGDRPHAVVGALPGVLGAGVDGARRRAATGTLSPQVRALLAEAQAVVPAVTGRPEGGNLGAYQTDINNMESDLQEVQQLTGWHRCDPHVLDHHDHHRSSSAPTTTVPPLDDQVGTARRAGVLDDTSDRGGKLSLLATRGGAVW